MKLLYSGVNRVHNDCYITLFLNNDDPRVKNLQLPDREVWWDTDALIQEMLWPIQLNQVTAAQDPDLKQAPNNQANQLIANYKSYLQKNLKAPQARLVKSLSDWASKDPEKQAIINYDAHFINFFPGMNYLALQVPYCQVLDSSAQSRGVWLLIQKTANQSPNENHYFIWDN